MTNRYPIIPDDAEVIRSSGLVICKVCGKELYDHEHYAYPNGLGYVVKGCDGRFYHL